MHKWIAGSPHSNIKMTDLALPKDNEEVEFLIEREQVLTLICGNEKSSGGVRYSSKAEDGVEWVTTLCCNEIDGQLCISVQVSCDKEGGVARLPPARKPHIIKMLLSEIGGGNDGDIPVADKSIPLPEGKAMAAAALINGLGKNSLPIIYVSRGFNGNFFIDPNRLARFVSGAAHVVSEPSRIFSNDLRKIIGQKAIYGGNVGIYWPDGNKWNYFPDDPPKELILDIWKSIRSASVNRRIPASLSWLYLKEQLAKYRIDRVRKEGDSNLDDYFNLSDAEISAKQARIDELESALARATSAVTVSSSARSSGSLIKLGDEINLYDNEIEDIIIDALINYKSSVGQDSRRRHVVESLLEANVKKDVGARIYDEIKHALRTSKDMDRQVRKVLEQHGFSISDIGKHYKVLYRDDGRYMFTFSKSSSDHRAGLNIAGEISRKLF